MEFGENVCLDEIRMSLKMGHVTSETRSLGQILEEPCVCTIGNIFSPIIMKHSQKVYFDEISDEFENGSCPVKNYVTTSNLRKTLCTLWRPDFWSNYHKTWSEWFSDESWMSLKMGHVRSETRSSPRKTLCTLLRPHFQSDNHKTS